MDHFLCATCGVQYAASDAPPAECPICEDPRQYVPEDGQRWTTMPELAASHANVVRPDEDLTGVATEPRFAIGQRMLVVPAGEGNVLWESISLFDEETAQAIEAKGPVTAIALSHPHYYSAMVEWARRFDCPVLVHADDARWIMRPDPAIELWSGESRALGDLTLVRCGGHFAGGSVLVWPGGAGGAGTLLSGDIVQVIPDRSHVGFMYSYPNLIPLPGEAVRAIADALEPYAFETIQGAWWGTTVRRDAKEVVRRSADRYVRALAGDMDE
jgi:glyoxylase-like metal-dependent hydrolase (beta-lactamase superfamily II)